MNAKKYAVIDLGSNTFHLLIVEESEGKGMSVLHRKRVFTALSDGGVTHIKAERFEHGLDTLRKFKDVLNDYGNPPLRVIGTAVLRQADNRNDFVNAAATILETNIEIIDGQQEAQYIYQGITMLDTLQTGQHLIMDIGGGSTEFIIVQNGQKVWSESYPLGVGILHKMFHQSDPISHKDLEMLRLYVLDIVAPLTDEISKYEFDSLTGASGSFEVLQSMSGQKISDQKISEIDLATFEKIYQEIIHSNIEQRSHLPGLPKERIKLIVVGMALKKVILDTSKAIRIFVSPYALKEGVLREMMM